MNWREILKNVRLASKGKSINIDSINPIESEGKDCYEQLIDYVQSCGLNIREEISNYVQFTDKKNIIILPKNPTRAIVENLCYILEDLKQNKILETKDAKKAEMLPDKETGPFNRYSSDFLNAVRVEYIVPYGIHTVYVFIKK